MPDVNRDYGLDNLKLVGGSTAIAGVITLVGALLAWFTGDGEAPHGGRGHLDAVYVLGVLGIAMLVVALLVASEHKSRSSSLR